MTGSSCPTIKLIGVRGSGEPQGLGKPVGAFSHALEKALHMSPADGQYWPVPLAYRAYLPTVKHWYNPYQDGRETQEYERSVRGGTKSLRTVLYPIPHEPCPHSRYIVAGYSQGAQVIGDAIAAGDLKRVRKRIIATALFGDPTFDATMRGVTFFGSFSYQTKGVLRRLGTRHRDDFRGYHVLSFCDRSDPFCQSNIDAIRKRKLGAHLHYQDREAEQAARWIASRFR